MQKLSLLLLGTVVFAAACSPVAHADEVSLSFDGGSTSVASNSTPESSSKDPNAPLALPPATQVPPVQPFSLENPELPPPPPIAEVTPAISTVAAAELPEQAPPSTEMAPAVDRTIAPDQAEAAPTSTVSEDPSLSIPSATDGAARSPQPSLLPAMPSEASTSASGGAGSAEVTQAAIGATRPAEVDFSLSSTRPVELRFERSTPINPPSKDAVGYSLDALFEGGADSLVARVVGSAEGTRTVDGQRTRAYYGHSDPGNGVWNLGSFSYQHGARSPEEADQKQLNRLRSQAEVLQDLAAARGFQLTLEEKLNGIDLADQAPAAALDRGYIDWLAEARRMGMAGEEAVLWARTRSFLDPNTQQWNAPGLGNNVDSISRDQERRLKAIARALDAFQQQSPGLATEEPTATQAGNPSSQPPLNSQVFSNPFQQGWLGKFLQTLPQADNAIASVQELLESGIDRLMQTDVGHGGGSATV